MLALLDSVKPRYLIPALLGALLVAYPLSIGPVLWWFQWKHQVEPRGFYVFYKPVMDVAYDSPKVMNALRRYAGGNWLPLMPVDDHADEDSMPENVTQRQNSK